MLKEIDTSKLLQEELVRQDLSLASVSLFLNIVCGGSTESMSAKKKEENKAKLTVSKAAIVPVFNQPRTDA